MIDKLQGAGVLRAELDPPQAVGLLSMRCSVEAFAEVTHRHVWTLKSSETWTVDALCWLLLNRPD